ncbi:MAG: secretin and TonB N-terminal domain-containing protein [Gallionellaceae bacterium]|nr:secretin and TonB N-terminal domain-containing protein [Gallionellaceae bacterium]
MNTRLIFTMRLTLLATAVLLLSSCAAERAYREGIALSNQGRIEEGLAKIQQASDESPSNAQYKMALVNRRTNAIDTLLLAADDNLNADKLIDAEAQYTRVLKLDKNNVRAKTGLTMVTRARKHAELMVAAVAELEAGEMTAVMEKIRLVLLENPRHREALALLKKIEEKQAKNKFTPPALRQYSNPITLEFRDAPVKMVFDVLSSTTGVNFILDKDLRPEQRVSIFAKQVTFDKALALLLDSNQLDKKVINENTLVVYPRTPQKSKEYEELMVKTFYLANADPKQTANMLKTILKVRDIYVDDRLNMVIMRDTPDTIRQAEKLIAAQDLPDAEVLLDVTVVEVKHGRLLDLGIQWPTQFGTLNINAPGSITLDSLRRLNRDLITAGSLPSATANEQISDLNVLANPRIRVRNREKAKIHVGDRVPVITTTTPTTANATASETVTYVDVGIKLEVEPNIYLEGDVAIKASLEVSSLGSATTTKNGSVVYQIGTRNASTLLRLKDGETQLLAGLINDEDRTSINGLPGLSDLPLIGRLFSSHKDERQKTEVVLSITPHIVRNIVHPSAGITQFWSGTEQGGQGIYTDGFTPPNWRDGPSGMPNSHGMPNTPGIPNPPGAMPGMPPMPGMPNLPHIPGTPMPPPGEPDADG